MKKEILVLHLLIEILTRVLPLEEIKLIKDVINNGRVGCPCYGCDIEKCDLIKGIRFPIFPELTFISFMGYSHPKSSLTPLCHECLPKINGEKVFFSHSQLRRCIRDRGTW